MIPLSSTLKIYIKKGVKLYADIQLLVVINYVVQLDLEYPKFGLLQAIQYRQFLCILIKIS